MADFLLEIGTEEIPARMLDAASAELQRRVAQLLTRERLSEAPALESYATPRRLAVLARAIAAAQPDVAEQVTGPSLKVAYKDGRPTPAAQAFAKKVGVPLDKLEKVTTAKGEYVAAKVTRRGRPAGEILAEVLPKEISGIYWPKTMYWRSPGERFVRPVRWLVATLDGEAVPLEFAGIKAGLMSRGHRTLGGEVRIAEPAAYAATLKEAGVFARSEERCRLIRSLLDKATRTVPGARWREDKELLNTVVNLTEFPSVVLGSFDREFLELAEEVLVTVMRDHQKYFAVEDASGKLLPHFLAVLNTDADPEGIIRHGHERVLRARFNDARFFWQTDQKIPLRERVSMLKAVTFQKDLGSYYEKTIRTQRLASVISQALKNADVTVRPGVIHKAALLAKTDLTTELVKEFTELQGIIGGLYARAQHLDPEMTESAHEAIATAIYDHYQPESTEDAVPRTVEGAVLSLADKADSIAGMFALGLAPSGSKDPFALRRQANGIVKIIAEHKFPLSVNRIMADARTGFAGSDAEKRFPTPNYASAVRDFFRERLEFYLREVRGFAYDVVNAVLAAGSDDVVDAVARAEAVAQVRGSEDFEHISVAFKRIKNILRQAAETGKKVGEKMDLDLLQEPAERELAAAIPEISAAVKQLAGERQYAEALEVIANIRPAVDTFFDKVMVMVEDEPLRANRLALLRTLLDEFTTIADFSEIVTEGK
jgi:glycyl-tRNA synthetase beta chain